MTSSSSQNQVEQNTITYNAAISACNWFCIRFHCSYCYCIPPKKHYKEALPYICFINSFLYLTIPLFCFSDFPWHMSLLYHQESVFHHAVKRYQTTFAVRHSGERGSQWPAALELLFSEMPMVSVERNIITFSAAISVSPENLGIKSENATVHTTYP